MTISFEQFHKQQKDSNIRSKMLAKKSNGRSNGKSPLPTETKRPPAWKLRMRDNKFKPDESDTRIRIIPTSDKSTFYKYYAKWVTTPEGQKRQIVSNSWNGDRELPCVLYYYCAEEENENMWADEKCAVTVFVMEDFYKIPHTSSNGYEYFTYERVPAPDRNGRITHPSSAHAEYDIVFGRKLWWELWPSQKRHLLDKLSEVSNRCSSCSDGEISTYGYQCANCKVTLADHKSEEGITEDDEDALRNTAVECEECGTIAQALPLIECVAAKGYGSRRTYVAGCKTPAQLNWQGCDIIIRADQVGGRTAIQVVDFSKSEPLTEVKDWALEPFDFDYFLGKQELDDQAKSMGRKNPFDAGSQNLLDQYHEAGHDEEDDDSIPF